VVSASTNTTDGVDLSELYIIDNNVADVMTESFGICEAALTSSEGAQIAALAQQAAAQGITYIVSSGDSGAEGCDDPNSEIVASGPLSVNALASTPYTVAVGGTIFNENKQDSKYWSSANGGTLGSALSYIPENAWNESCTAGKCGKNAGIWAGGGGASSLFAKPSWQSGVAGIPNDHARDVPDVSLAAGSHDAYLLCLGGSCVPDAKGNIQLWLVSGTSAAAPSFASIMALVDANMEVLLGPAQKRQGQANYSLYAVAALNPSTCNGSSTTSLPTSNCIFNDTTIGNNAVPGEIRYGSISARYQSGKGYDLATGLGSVNAGNLVRQWPAASFQATSTSLSLTPSPTTITHGQLVTVNIAVSSTSAGTPTGDVSLLTDAGQSVNLCVSPGGCTLSSGALSAATYLLPGYKDSTGNPVTYNIHAHYAGDGTFSPSDSAVWPVTVSPEPSTTTLSLFGGSTISPVPFLSGVSSSLVFLRADVTAQSLVGTATGSVVFMDGGTPIGSPYELTSAASTITPNGISGFLPGQHTITAQYSGDGSFNSSLSNAVSFTIIPDFALAATLPSLVIGAPGQSGTLKVMVNGQTGFNGTMKFTGASCAGLPVEASCSFTPSSVTGSGSTILTVTTAGPHAVLMIPQRRYLWSLAAISFAFGLLLPCAPQKRRRWAKMVGIISVLVLSVAVGCGSGGTSAPSDPGTPAGSYPVTVTASTGTLTHTVRFTLLIQ